MTEPEKRRGGGAKMSRSETVTVRLDPRLRYLAELAARVHRRTLSSYIEEAVEEYTKAVELPGSTGAPKTLEGVSTELWDVDAADRLVKLGQHFPALLTYEEQRVWKVLRELIDTREEGSTSPQGQYVLDMEVLRQHWDLINKAAAQGKGPSVVFAAINGDEKARFEITLTGQLIDAVNNPTPEQKKAREVARKKIAKE